MPNDFLKNHPALIKDILAGLEREALRCKETGILSDTLHPKKLGSSLTHPYITNDFAESQVELITPPLKTNEEAIDFLERVTSYVIKNTDDLLWPSSMPCLLPKDENIKIATFQNHPIADDKRVYREGLITRYGLKMQMLSGIHYNFSFGNDFFTKLFDYSKKNCPNDLTKGNSLKDFVSSIYLQTARNFLEEGWLITYLFGASPKADPSYHKIPDLPLATSLRMSKYGYFSRTQCQSTISFNSLPEYIRDLKKAISTPFLPYKKYKNQLNDHLLQIENEHYTRIRPKTNLLTLEKKGIQYLEIRSLDVNPFESAGVSISQLDFIKNFLFYCALKPHLGLTPKIQKVLCKNQEDVALFGRKKGLKLTKGSNQISLQDWGNIILDDMESSLDVDVSEQREVLKNPELTLSGKILDQDFLAFNLSYANCHNVFLRTKFTNSDLASTENTKNTYNLPKNATDDLAKKNIKSKTLSYEYFENVTEKSIRDADIQLTEESTQFLIKEAIEQNIKVELLDPLESFIRLTKDGKTQYVKQATKTSKDTYVTYHLLSDKKMTKKLLEEKGISVPLGKTYHQDDSNPNNNRVYDDYKLFKDKEIVVKPNETNCGIGISFIGKNDLNGFKKAVDEAFELDNQIIIEEFIKGQEHRILVIDNKVVAICERDPASIVGDGNSTIYELVQLKNLKKSVDKIKLGKKELENIAPYNSKTILKENEKLYLRKNSNISTGGDSIDRTDQLDSKFTKIAIDAAKILDAKICGVDMIIDNNNYSIIEMNYNPTITIHHNPDIGSPINIAKEILSFIFKENQTN